MEINDTKSNSNENKATTAPIFKKAIITFASILQQQKLQVIVCYMCRWKNYVSKTNNMWNIYSMKLFILSCYYYFSVAILSVFFYYDFFFFRIVMFYLWSDVIIPLHPVTTFSCVKAKGYYPLILVSLHLIFVFGVFIHVMVKK